MYTPDNILFVARQAAAAAGYKVCQLKERHFTLVIVARHPRTYEEVVFLHTADASGEAT